MSTRRSSAHLTGTLVVLGFASVSAHAWFPVPNQTSRPVVSADHEEPLELIVRVPVEPGTPADAKIVDPVPITKVDAVYPERAKKERVTGTVVARLTIGADGQVKKARIVKSIPLLDQATLDAVKQWTFKPGTVDGKRIEVQADFAVKFTLK